jgi:arylsulfatase A-like enzyme
MQYKRAIRFVSALMLFILLGTSLSACASQSGEKHPNIVVILTDDLDSKLMPYMPNANKLVGEQGATFTNYFVTSAVCCPSRASMFCGQYPHNTDILDNFPGFKAFYNKGEETNTFAVSLKDAGYQTALIGKYLNYYPVPAGWSYVPPGWTEWDAFLHQTIDEESLAVYNNYRMNENGKTVEYGAAPEDYSTDVIKQKSIDFLNKNKSGKSPFFLLVSVYAPHGPSDAAPRHADMFQDIKYPESPSFGEQDVSDKPEAIRVLAEDGDIFDAGDANTLFRKRAQTVQAVDELIADVMKTLEQNGQLENTYVIFTSDNGFHMGEHGLPSGKGTPYEEDIHVPFFIRGPGIQAGSEVTQMVANIDLAPTFVDIANASPYALIDGRSFLPLLQLQQDSPIAWRNALLVEKGYPEETSSLQLISFDSSEAPPVPVEYPDSIYDDYLRKVGGGVYQGVRTETFTYVEYDNGETEYYDLVNDPYELNNIASTLDPSTQASLHDWLTSFKACKADDCRKYDTMPEALAK